MKSRLADPHRIAGVFRYAIVALLAAISSAALVGGAAVDALDARATAARAADAARAGAVSKADALVDRQKRGLEQLSRIAATASDAVRQQFLDSASALAPGFRGAALVDAAGTIEQRSAGGVDETALAALAADAARQASEAPIAAILVTQTLNDGDAAIVGLARPWLDPAGRLGGLALVALDSSAFNGSDLVRGDGSPLFGRRQPGDRHIALHDVPLMVGFPTPKIPAIWPRAAVGGIGIVALAVLLALLLLRLRATRRDTARRVAVEEDLREALSGAAANASRYDQVSRAKSQFFAQVTHELRTPLNAILGFSETIRGEIFGPVANPRYREYAGLIHSAGTHLLSLINDLLDEARIEAGKMEIVPIRVTAPALARSALDLVELLAQGRDIALATTGLSSCPDLNVDPRAMKQVLVNLLSNAIKYTPPGGRIDMRLARCDADGLAIEIADTGIGMSPQDLNVAFEPFGRAGDSEVRRQAGSGLGLSLARALVRLHGGDLTLASRRGAGTTATIILPASAVFAAAGRGAPVKAA